MRNLFVALIAVATAAVALAAQNPQKPGKWEVKMEMEMPGMPMKMPPITTEVCLTEADIADPQKSVPKDPKSDCTVSDHKIKDNTVTWKMSCPKQNMTGSGEITYSGDTYTGAMKMKIGEREMSTKYTGKWIGTCSK